MDALKRERTRSPSQHLWGVLFLISCATAPTGPDLESPSECPPPVPSPEPRITRVSTMHSPGDDWARIRRGEVAYAGVYAPKSGWVGGRGSPVFAPGEPLPPGIEAMAVVSARLAIGRVIVHFDASEPLHRHELVLGADPEDPSVPGRQIEVSEQQPIGNGWWRATAEVPWYAYTPWESISYAISTADGELGYGSVVTYRQPDEEPKRN